MRFRAAIQRELPPMLRLALPVIAAELGWMAMGLVDIMMVGRVSAAAVGAVGLGGMLFYTVAVFGAGLMMGLDTLVSQAYGAGDLPGCHRALLNSLYVFLPLAPLIMLYAFAIGPWLPAFGTQEAVAREAAEYLRAVAWGSLPLLTYFALRHYLQSMNLVHPVMFALISANAVHLLANWILIYGNWGAPAMGAAGAGWATCFSRVYMAACLGIFVIWHASKYRTGLFSISARPDWDVMRRLVSLGIPAGVQISLEVGVFAAATTFAARLAPAVLAAHQIVLNCASLTYMVPLGVASAGAVRVGQAIGRNEPGAAKDSGWTAIVLAAAFMACSGLCFSLFPRQILRLYTPDALVIAAGVPLMFVAALFQLFDGLQTASTGALRGMGDTRTPMIWGVIGYWAVGLPVGYWLCFGIGWGATGLWLGLCLALMMVGAALLVVWARAVQTLE